MKIENQRQIGVVLTYLSEAVKILTGLIYTPVMLRILGQNEYGLYQMVFSVVSYLSLLGMGFSGSYLKFFSRYDTQNNKNGIAKLNGMFLTIFLLISMLCIISGSIMVINIGTLLGSKLTIDEIGKAKILMVMLIFSMAITFPNSVFECNLIAHEQFVFQKIVSLLQALFNPFLSLPLLLMGYGSVGIVFISSLLTLVVLITNIFYSVRYLKMSFTFRGFEFSLLKEMWTFTFFIFLGQIIDQINWNVDKYLLGRIIGTTAVAVYGVGAQINTMYLQFSTAISNVFVPTVNRIVSADDDNKKLTELLTRVGRIQFFVIMLVLMGFFFVGRTFISLWVGNEYYESYLVTLFLIVPVTVPLIQNLGIEIQKAKNKHKSRALVYFVISIANIIISIPLIQSFGATGAAAGTAIALFIGNVLFINWYYHFKLGLDMRYFWTNIFKIVPSMIIPCLCGVLYTKCFQVKTFFGVLLFSIVFSLIYFVSIWFCGFNKYEKSMITDVWERVRK